MQMYSLNEKLWSGLVEVLDYYEIPITGEDPDRKLRWLLLAIACGVQLAMRIAPDEWIEVDVRPGNNGTAGEVDVGFSVALIDVDDTVILRAPARFFFRQPDLTRQFEAFVGQMSVSTPFKAMARNTTHEASKLARALARMFDAYYFEWWLVEQLGYEEVVFGGW